MSEQNEMQAANNSCFCGEVGQSITIQDQTYYIGDIVLLTDRKAKVSMYYQIIWSTVLYRIMLESKTNGRASCGHPSGAFWHTRAYIDLFEITENHIPYVGIERIGNSKKDLKLIKPISLNKFKPY